MKTLSITILLMVSVSLFAQVSIQQQLVMTQNDGTNGGLFKVAVQVKGTNLTAANTLFSSTIDVAYDSLKLRFPTTIPGMIGATSWNPSIALDAYNPRSTSNPGGFVRILLGGQGVNSAGDGTPVGFDITGTYQTVVTLTFTIVDRSQSASMGIRSVSNAFALFSAHNNEDLDNWFSYYEIDPSNVSRTGIVDQPLPITLASFTARINPSGAGVRLDWGTLSEVNNYGFYVQRKLEADSVFTELPNSFVAGHGTTVEPRTYSFVDNTLTKAGRYYYRLRQVDLNGSEHYSSGTGVGADLSLMSVREAAPIEFKLHQNYPNPFNPSTEIKFSVEATGRATVRIYSITGQEVATLFDDVAEAGQYYRVRLDGSSLATGVYFYRLESSKKSDLKKMMLLK